jgi:hypothetical protein
MSYYIYLASNTPVGVILGFFFSLGGWLLVNYIYIQGA